jgi:site-specific DNA-methyltransferase (adenine-specific)
MTESYTQVLKSQDSDKWMTPPELKSDIMRRWNLSYDPCPIDWTPENDVPNGLQVRWEDRAFVNPPYSDIPSWLEKAQREILKHGTEIAVFLVYTNTDTSWFHDYVLGQSRIHFIEGRVTFVKPSGEKTRNAMRPSMVCVFTEETIRDGVDEQDLRSFGNRSGRYYR